MTLQDFQKLLASVGDSVSEIPAALVERVLALVQDGIKAGVDPYGNEWPAKKDGSKALQGLEDTFSATASDGKIVLKSSEPFTSAHQTGTDRLPQRMMVPDPTKGLGQWAGTIRNEIERVLKNRLK